MSPNTPKELLSIGEVAQRVGLATSAIRFYEDKGLVQPERNAAGHRRYRRSTVRRLSFILIAQQLGYGLNTIKAHLATLPSDTAPADEDWERLARQFGHELDQRIAALTDLRNKLDGCIGCGCLSLERCALYNPDDQIAIRGHGPRFLMGDESAV